MPLIGVRTTDVASWRGGLLRLVVVLATTIGLVTTAGLDSAVAETGQSATKAAQYVFVVDDSGSMSKRVRGEPPADPDRLAVFAVRSILSMLNDRDQASVVRLNGPADGDEPPPLQPLADNRSRLRTVTELDGELAAYDGSKTPCRSALNAVKSRLVESHRSGVPQVLMFLTDGACTGRAPNPEEFLRGIPSMSEDLFKFYLLRFSGRDYTEALQAIAERTGGTSIEVSADDPTSILGPFARALSDSQGYRSYLLTPSDPELSAHGAAHRMRLLAVVPGEGPSLSIGIEGRGAGEEPTAIEESRRSGVHRYRDGNTFRYAALDYRPGDVPVSVGVEGADADWKVVSVPEYRLYTNTRIYSGECGTGGESVGSVEVGATSCVEVQLVNHRGEVVSADAVGGGTEAVVEYRPPGADEARRLPANRVGDDARYRLERVNLEEGNHLFDPVVEMTTPGGGDDTVDIEGAARTLQVSTLNVSATPSDLSLGTFKPGASDFHEIEIEGNFPASQARLTVRNRENVPECVQFRLNDVAEGKPQELSAGQTATIGVEVAPYCGPTAIDRRFDTALRIEFADSATRSIPTLVIPVTFALDSKLSVPSAIELSVAGGEATQTDVELAGNFSRKATFRAMVPAVDQRAAWPGDDLSIRFLGDDSEVRRDGGRPAREVDSTFPPGGGTGLRLQIAASTCCTGGTYETELALVPTSGTSEPIRVPLRIDVDSASLFACWGRTILFAIVLVLLVLAGLYGWGMYRGTHLVDSDRMAAEIKPLIFDGYGNPTPAAERQKGRARDMIEDQFDDLRWDRVKAWFRANPLKFGLPGGSYHECIQFSVDSRRPEIWLEDVKGVTDFRSEVGSDPATHRKLMFVQAQPGLEFFGVPDDRNQIAGLELERTVGGLDDDEVVTLRDHRLVRQGDGEEGEIAGWEIG